jgi:hypothetical protein
MYLFTRTGRFQPGSIRESTEYIRAVTDKVRQETGLEVHVWATMMSPEFGTTVWGTFVDDLAHLEEAEDKLMVSESFLDLAEKGNKLLDGPLTDNLAQVVHGAPDLSGPLPNYLAVARATAANGQLRAALAGGVEIAETATRITGVGTTFMVEATGPYGGCRWASRYTDLGELERAESALMADESWLEVIDRVGPAYTQDARQSILRRID